MAKQLELMKLRERRIGELVELLDEKSKHFTNPEIIVIGGYALRAFIPFSRYSRDCDFALPKRKDWAIDKIEKWFPNSTVEAEKKFPNSGYLRLIELLQAGRRKIKISLDFMEGRITGRKDEVLLIDETFLEESSRQEIQIGDKKLRIRVPSYQDFFLLKLLSARPSDIRDIAALIWKKGIPDPVFLAERARETIREQAILREKIKTVIGDISHPSFLDSWRGTFMNEDFTDGEKRKAQKKLKDLEKILLE